MIEYVLLGVVLVLVSLVSKLFSKIETTNADLLNKSFRILHLEKEVKSARQLEIRMHAIEQAHRKWIKRFYYLSPGERKGMDIGIREQELSNRVSELEKECTKLQKIIDTHDLCHDLHGQVGPEEFAKGCEQEQRKVFGCAPTADKLEEANQKIAELTNECQETERVNPESTR